jgi:8-oxo-dGTP pyrophosphatase MutT (NUDIX family)
MNVGDIRHRLDAILGARSRRVSDRADLIPAAVLLPIIDHGEPHLVFTKKSELVPHHRGQFSFPGGIVEQSDGSRVETALREAWEEIRLPAESVEVLGILDDTETRATPFVITPVVGLVRGPVTLEPDGREIERIIEVPLATLRDPTIFRTEMCERDGAVHPVHFFDVSRHDVIWGATARILRQFLDLLDGPEQP